MIRKSMALQKPIEFNKSTETQIEKPIKGLNTGRIWIQDIYDNGLKHLNTMPYTSEQNENGLCLNHKDMIMDSTKMFWI